MSQAREWLEKLKGDVSWRKVAEAADLAVSTLNRQINDGSIQPRTIVQIARHFGESPLPGLVAIRLLTEEDVARIQVGMTLLAADDEALVKEVLRRIKDAPDAHPALTEPIPDTAS